MSTPPFRRTYDFREPLDEAWEAIPEEGWTFDTAPGAARLANITDGNAEIYLRPCAIYGDTYQFALAPGARSGVFAFGFQAGFEYIRFELDLASGELAVRTHEFHKAQPRLARRVAPPKSSIALTRERDDLPGLPYEGSRVTLLIDGGEAAVLEQIDFLPESLFMFSLRGKGQITLSSLTITGPERPRPEFVNVGVWQQSIKPTTGANVDALIVGVRQAAEAGVEILLTPETSLTGLRPLDPELSDRALVASELERFGRAVSEVPGAPHTLTGYPEWVDGACVDGADLPEVKVNAHRFVRPDGSVGPMMAKVHSCEEGLWHGRAYNLQRVRGVEVAAGVCHDARYPDVWATGVMGGARLCLHPAAGGTVSGSIPDMAAKYGGSGNGLDAYWVCVNAGGGGAIVYPNSNRKHPDTVLAVTRDMTEDSPTHPDYSSMGDLLAHKRIRLWDATGCYPMRTLRSGRAGYEAWSRLVPEIKEV